MLDISLENLHGTISQNDNTFIELAKLEENIQTEKLLTEIYKL